jgi:hypothetical protein
MRLAAAAAFLALCSPGSAGTTPNLVAKVVLASAEPQCSGTTCAQPARLVVVRFTNGAGVLRSAKTDTVGVLRTRIPAGTYRVSTARTESDPEARITPSHITIRNGSVTRVTFVYRVGTP